MQGTTEEITSPPNSICPANDSASDDVERQLLMQQGGLANIDEFPYMLSEPGFTLPEFAQADENVVPDSRYRGLRELVVGLIFTIQPLSAQSELVMGLIFKTCVPEVNELVIGTTITYPYYYSVG